MIRKEAVILAVPEPAVLRQLGDLRSRIVALDTHIATSTANAKLRAQHDSSAAREKKYHEIHSRIQKEESLHRPSDRTFAIRPESLADKDLDAFQSIRRWYAGGDARMVDSLREAHPQPSLVTAGYLVASHQVPANTKPVPRHDAAKAQAQSLHEVSSSASLSGSSSRDPYATGNARATIRRYWQEHSTSTHWMNRDSSLANEKQLGQQLLHDTGYTPNFVSERRPYKEFPRYPKEVHSNEFKRPNTPALLAKEQFKYEAAKDRDPTEARRRAQLLRSSRPEDYFGGGH